jgi:DMSO reductase anchor subunit
MSETTRSENRRATSWLKRLGVGGFLFFLVKGLLWLIVPALLVFFGC